MTTTIAASNKKAPGPASRGLLFLLKKVGLLRTQKIEADKSTSQTKTQIPRLIGSSIAYDTERAERVSKRKMRFLLPIWMRLRRCGISIVLNAVDNRA
jgi:hypothetical protein